MQKGEKMIGLVIALKKEEEKLLSIANDINKVKLADKEAYECSLLNKKCIIAISGIGKVSSALTTQLLIDKYNIDFILNFGTCGGMNQTVKIKNYYAVSKCCQYDFDLTELDPVPLGYIQDYDRVFFDCYTTGIDFLEKTVLASADKFTNKNIDVKTVNEMGCSLCDMEGSAIAQVCTSNSIPLVMVKGITDVYGSQTAPEQFMENLTEVSNGFPEVILKVIENVSKSLKI